jgi:hypothetical protein
MTADERRQARTRATNKIQRLRRDVKAISRQIVALELTVAAIDEGDDDQAKLFSSDEALTVAGDPA